MDWIKIKNDIVVYIIMPIYNGEKYLLEQLMSIYYQSYTNWFLIIINDWSIDSTLDIINKFIQNYNLKDKVSIINKENWWVCSAVSEWLQKVKKYCDIYKSETFISYCDADDIWTRNKLKDQVEFMLKNKHCWLSFHDLCIIDENWVIKVPSQLKTCYQNNTFDYVSMISNHVTSTWMMFRTKYIDKLVPFPTWTWLYQDCWTLLVIALIDNNVQYMEGPPLAYYRQWHTSLMKISKNETKLNRAKSRLKYLTYLQKKFPDKNISRNIEFYNDFFINRRHYFFLIKLIMTLIKYPRAFYLASCAVFYKLYKKIF